MNTASTSGSGPLPSNTIANPNGELKAITTRSGLVLDGPSVPMPPPFINSEKDERAEETLTDPKLAEYTIKVPPPLVQKVKPHSLRNYVAICTPAGISRDVFAPVGKFTFPVDFVIVDYKSDPRVPLILGRPFLQIARALIDVHGEEMDCILEDSVDECNLEDPNNDLVDTILEMFTDEHTLDYSSPPLYDDVNDDLVELDSDNDDDYDDPFDSKEDKIKKSKLLIDELDPPRSSDFLLSPSMTR
nr:reverse transcriptase domain-containing protein [Tanacetum cinerariifolium]